MMLAIAIISIAIAAINAWVEYSRDLMMLQQNSYRINRYRLWLNTSGDTTSAWRICGLIMLMLGLVSLSQLINPAIYLSAATLFGIISAYTLLKRKYKKPLVWTQRARRIYAVQSLLSIVIAAAVYYVSTRYTDSYAPLAVTVALVGCWCGSHIITMCAVALLHPVEKAINRRYYNDAARILNSMPDLKIIGITGSYGKTSTKHYLYTILSQQFDTAMTPGSYNTTLGVVRTIREYLKPYNEIFIVEMGAKSRGDIDEICRLVHPEIGIITAVGSQHLESFKTIENVQAAKFELADALPHDGYAVINNDFPMIASRAVDNATTARYGLHNEAGMNDSLDYTADGITYSHTGTTFTVNSKDGWSLKLRTRLVGECNISNLVAAVAVARRLGVTDSNIAIGVERIAPVEHRLSMKRTPGGITILDDAFNSNPVGSKMALEVLAGLTEGKRIIVTPGMIELGDKQQQLNTEFGEMIARSADVAIIVGHYNREAIIDGIKRSGILADESVHAVETFNDAQRILQSIMKSGDTVLYENDLPDTFK